MNEGEARLIAGHLVGLDVRMKTVGDLLTRLTSGGGALDAGSYQFSAAGVIARDYTVPFAAVAIVNRSAKPIICEAAPQRDAPPLTGVAGPGIWDLLPNEAGVMNVSGYALTIYGGDLGERVNLQVFGRPQAPAWAVVK